MPLASFNLVRIIGNAGDSDTWSCGFHFGTTAGEAGVDDEAGLTAWANAIHQLQSGKIVGDTALAFLGTAFNITGVRVSAVSGVTGRETAMGMATLGAAVPGGNNTVQAQEVACCVSLLTGRPGRQNRGRVYWPGSGRGVTAVLRYAAGDTSGLASDMATFLSDAAAAGGAQSDGSGQSAGGTVRPLVVSRKGLAVSLVTQVAVGDIPDVQRRRRNKEKETYSVHAVA